MTYPSQQKQRNTVKVFDFDNTIYRGESGLHFAFYMIKHNKKIIRYIPKILVAAVKYELCWLSKEKLESIINSIFAGVLDGTESPEELAAPFWEKRTDRLHQNILSLIEPEDVIISASPVFLLDCIREYLKTDHIIGTEMDVAAKKITWFNFGDNKVKRYTEQYGDRKIDAFYTDSYNDRAMMEIAEEVYIVKKGVPVKLTKRSK